MIKMIKLILYLPVYAIALIVLGGVIMGLTLLTVISAGIETPILALIGRTKKDWIITHTLAMLMLKMCEPVEAIINRMFPLKE